MLNTRHASRAIALLSLVALVLACSRETSSSSSSTTAPVASASARDVPAIALQKACAAMCMLPGNSVQVYRDDNEAPRRLYALGTGCPHGPTSYLDMQGTVVGTVANQLVVRGSPEDAQFRERHAEQQRGLHPSESLTCPRPPPL